MWKPECKTHIKFPVATANHPISTNCNSPLIFTHHIDNTMLIFNFFTVTNSISVSRIYPYYSNIMPLCPNSFSRSLFELVWMSTIHYKNEFNTTFQRLQQKKKGNKNECNSNLFVYSFLFRQSKGNLKCWTYLWHGIHRLQQARKQESGCTYNRLHLIGFSYGIATGLLKKYIVNMVNFYIVFELWNFCMSVEDNRQ